MDWTGTHLLERHKKLGFFWLFFLKARVRVSQNPKNPYQKKTEIFLEFFLKEGVVLPIPKGCYHKKWGYWGISAKKGGSHPIHRDFIIKN